MLQTRESLLKQITITDFIAADLQLYLNTHPNDTEALRMFDEVVVRGARIREEYENMIGPLMPCNNGNESWRWSGCPWPWESESNFSWDEVSCEEIETNVINMSEVNEDIVSEVSWEENSWGEATANDAGEDYL